MSALPETDARRVAVVLATRDPRRAAEALRAALGLTLRGARVVVVRLAGADPGDARAARLLATLAALGHATDGDLDALREADAVEVWT